VKGLVEQVCGALGVEARLVPGADAFVVQGQSATVVAGTTEIGIVGLVAPATAESRDAPRNDRIFVAELNLDRIWTARHRSDDRVVPLPRYPSVVRDISIVVGETLPAEIIRGTIQAAGRAGAAPLAALAFFDRYKGKGVPDGSVSVSVRLT